MRRRRCLRGGAVHLRAEPLRGHLCAERRGLRCDLGCHRHALRRWRPGDVGIGLDVAGGDVTSGKKSRSRGCAGASAGAMPALGWSLILVGWLLGRRRRKLSVDGRDPV